MAPPAVAVTLVTVAGQRRPLELPAPVTCGALHDAAAAALGLQPGRFKLLLRGAALGGGAGGAAAAAPAGVADGDALVVVPQRRAPTEAVQAAAAEALGQAPRPAGDDDDDDAPVRFRLAPGAPAWHGALARLLQHKLSAPDLLLAWIFHLGPGRIAAFLVVLMGSRVASAFGLGPLYLMAAILAGVMLNLGERREGEASAYSVFNPGVRRLPGQLDADVLDEQIRRGAGVG
ncbi:MAG: hypothetical protein J3K34DRAFT_520143 [Monoraphidium minutum]|nr:MAG: hypothetical protein J3K34DRAFT_520143 [Monoraphidium minutum]